MYTVDTLSFVIQLEEFCCRYCGKFEKAVERR